LDELDHLLSTAPENLWRSDVTRKQAGRSLICVVTQPPVLFEFALLVWHHVDASFELR
jgi:hypothetical protein